MWLRPRHRKLESGSFMPVLSLLSVASSQSTSEFMERHPPHALLIQSCAPQASSSFLTHRSGPQGSQSGPQVCFLDASVQPLSIGRAENSAVVLRFDGISRLHALLATDPSPRIMDAGSSFGTTVNGAPLRPNQFVPLQPGDTIGFADLSATYHTASTLHTHLIQLWRQAG